MNTSSRPLILLLFANAYSGDLSSVAKERQELLQLLRTEIDKSALDIEVDSIDYTTIDGVLKALNLQQDRLAILHFAGHSGTDLLQLDEGKAYARGIASKLGACPNLKLVFLNGCNNTELVKAIAEEEVPTVIGTRKPVMDKAALRFSKGFFNALAVQRKTLAESWFQGKSDAESEVEGQYRSLDIKQPASTQEWA